MSEQQGFPVSRRALRETAVPPGAEDLPSRRSRRDPASPEPAPGGGQFADPAGPLGPRTPVPDAVPAVGRPGPGAAAPTPALPSRRESRPAPAAEPTLPSRRSRRPASEDADVAAPGVGRAAYRATDASVIAPSPVSMQSTVRPPAATRMRTLDETGALTAVTPVVPTGQTSRVLSDTSTQDRVRAAEVLRQESAPAPRVPVRQAVTPTPRRTSAMEAAAPAVPGPGVGAAPAPVRRDERPSAPEGLSDAAATAPGGRGRTSIGQVSVPVAGRDAAQSRGSVAPVGRQATFADVSAQHTQMMDLAEVLGPDEAPVPGAPAVGASRPVNRFAPVGGPTNEPAAQAARVAGARVPTQPADVDSEAWAGGEPGVGQARPAFGHVGGASLQPAPGGPAPAPVPVTPVAPIPTRPVPAGPNFASVVGAGEGHSPRFAPIDADGPIAPGDVYDEDEGVTRIHHPWWYTALKVIVIVLVAIAVGFGVWLVVDKAWGAAPANHGMQAPATQVHVSAAAAHSAGDLMISDDLGVV